jgi:hypothetical protein
LVAASSFLQEPSLVASFAAHDLIGAFSFFTFDLLGLSWITLGIHRDEVG